MEINLPEIRSARAADNGDDTKEPCSINEVEKRRCKIRAAFTSLGVSEKEFWID